MVPELPDQRDVHSQDGGLLCGGDLARSTCLALDTATGQWQPAANLLEERYDHVSWASEAGVVLMGGGSSRNTTEIVREDGSVETGFDLVLDTWCVENLPTSASSV